MPKRLSLTEKLSYKPPASHLGREDKDLPNLILREIHKMQVFIHFCQHLPYINVTPLFFVFEK